MGKFSESVKHRGVPFEYGDEIVIIPALTASQIEALVPQLMAHDAMEVKDITGVNNRIQARIPIIAMALRRNYPDLLTDEITDFLTGENHDRAFSAALGTDRVTKKIKLVGEYKPAE